MVQSVFENKGQRDSWVLEKSVFDDDVQLNSFLRIIETCAILNDNLKNFVLSTKFLNLSYIFVHN